ncbi:MAG: hypothetical protein ACPLSY_03575 [Moorellaceae bacterium]
MAIKLTHKEAISKAISRAIDTYYQASSSRKEAELVGRVFQEYVNLFRRVVWSAENVVDFIAGIESIIGPLPEWVTKDLI